MKNEHNFYYVIVKSSFQTKFRSRNTHLLNMNIYLFNISYFHKVFLRFLQGNLNENFFVIFIWNTT